MKTLTTMTEKELLYLANDALLDRWLKEYEFLTKNPENIIAKARVEKYDKQIDEIQARIIKLEQAEQH